MNPEDVEEAEFVKTYISLLGPTSTLKQKLWLEMRGHPGLSKNENHISLTEAVKKWKISANEVLPYRYC